MAAAAFGVAVAATVATVLTLGMTPYGDLGLTGGWRNAAGTTLPDGTDGAVRGPLTIRTDRGAAHCDLASAVVLQLAWPPGTVVDASVDRSRGAVRSYVRDPKGVFGDTGTSFAVVGTAPSASVATGFRRWGNTVAVDPTGDAYVTRPGGSVERWPQLADHPGCD